MKENRKLLREVLKDIRHDMTDEEVLNLLADSKISEKSRRRKGKIHPRPAGGGRHREICGRLGVHLFLHRRADFVDARQHAARGKSV